MSWSTYWQYLELSTLYNILNLLNILLGESRPGFLFGIEPYSWELSQPRLYGYPVPMVKSYPQLRWARFLSDFKFFCLMAVWCAEHKTTRRQEALDYDRNYYVFDLSHFVYLVCLCSSAWILLCLSCNSYVTLDLIDVKFGDFISVRNLQSQFIPVHSMEAYRGSGGRAPFILSLCVVGE